MILSDISIRSRMQLRDSDCRHLRIEPFAPLAERPGVISYGLTSGGYDCRLGNKFKVLSGDARNSIISPKRDISKAFVDIESDSCVIPPHSFALALSMERFRIPRDVLGICMNKSTYARCGIIANVTPLEPEWEGHITIEVSNTSDCRAEIHAGEGILQILFVLLDELCGLSYADKKGRYQGQQGITLPFVR